MLMTAAEEEDEVIEGALKGLQGWLDCYEKTRLLGKVFAGGVTAPDEIGGSDKLREAYEMGRAIS